MSRSGTISMERKVDDLSCDPSKWSFDKLRREYYGGRGFLAVIAEYERRMRALEETDD